MNSLFQEPINLWLAHCEAMENIHASLWKLQFGFIFSFKNFGFDFELNFHQGWILSETPRKDNQWLTNVDLLLKYSKQLPEVFSEHFHLLPGLHAMA